MDFVGSGAALAVDVIRLNDEISSKCCHSWLNVNSTATYMCLLRENGKMGYLAGWTKAVSKSPSINL